MVEVYANLDTMYWDFAETMASCHSVQVYTLYVSEVHACMNIYVWIIYKLLIWLKEKKTST